MTRRRDTPLYAANAIHSSLQRLADNPYAGRTAEAIEGLTNLLPKHGPIKDALSGTWLDHPVHPMLTDLPIGFWTSAMLLDFVGGARNRDAARVLVGAGILCSVPTALTGAADWADTQDRARRVGALHALVNSSAVACYVASWNARRRSRHRAGVALGLAGATLATMGGLLGGHLVSSLGVGVDHTVFREPLDDWTTINDLDSVPEGASKTEVDGERVLLVRRGSTIRAVAAVCPHRGAPLGPEDAAGDIVTCPWHGSEFCIADGRLIAGPSPTPLRSYETRVKDGVVEIRTATNRKERV